MERIYFVDFAKLHAQGGRGVLLTRLMMAVNDLVLANVSMRPYVTEPQKTGAHARYFFRLQCGHLAEGLRLVTLVNKEPRLKQIVNQCSARARATFEKLMDHAVGADSKQFNERVRAIRNKVGFHYDKKKVGAALARRARRQDLTGTKITLADDIEDCRFNAADDIEASVVTRLLWKIPETAQEDTFQSKTDEHLQYVNKICKQFVVFHGEFLLRALRDLGVLRH
jgi:hypothetical protein